MSRREYLLTFRCKHEGCTERTTYRYDTQRDLRESWARKTYETKGWLCVRHNAPNEVLSIDNPETTFEVTSRQTEHGCYFGSHGFMHGPGFKMFANDFPAGTKLVVTARVELPAAAEIARAAASIGKERT